MKPERSLIVRLYKKFDPQKKFVVTGRTVPEATIKRKVYTNKAIRKINDQTQNVENY